jgi:hypothetical protein
VCRYVQCAAYTYRSDPCHYNRADLELQPLLPPSRVRYLCSFFSLSPGTLGDDGNLRSGAISRAVYSGRTFERIFGTLLCALNASL